MSSGHHIRDIMLLSSNRNIKWIYAAVNIPSINFLCCLQIRWLKGLQKLSFLYFGSIAQLVQSICFTSRGSKVRIFVEPHNKPENQQCRENKILLQSQPGYSISRCSSMVRVLSCQGRSCEFDPHHLLKQASVVQLVVHIWLPTRRLSRVRISSDAQYLGVL